MEDALKLFFSYSHVDEALRDELGRHLRILEYQKLISSWHDRKISPGDVWDEQITINQNTADIILLLISSDFIASRYCWDIEIRRAMELHESGKARVIPVILRYVDWANAPFSRLQALPQNAQPVMSFPDRDVAFTFITQRIRQVAEELIERRRQQQEQQQKEANIAAYRRKFQEFAANGEISLGEQFILDNLQSSYRLADLEVQEIEQAALSSTNQDNLDNYRQFFVNAIAQHSYPFTDAVRREAILVQNHLGLSDAEVARIEEAIAPPFEHQLGSEQADQTVSNPSRRPNRTYQELKEIALSNQVGELFSYLTAKLAPGFFWSGTNRSSITFSSKSDRKLLFSLNPIDSNFNRGLKFQIYIERLAEHLNTEVDKLISVLPEYKIAWEAEWSGTVYEGFFKTLREAERFLSALSNQN